VTKVWVVDEPELASITLLLRNPATGTWTTAVPATTIQPVEYMILSYDQYGDPFDIPLPVLRAAGTEGQYTETPTNVDTGVYTGFYGTLLGLGTWNFLAFDDTNGSVALAPEVGEVQSNIATYIIQ